MKKIYVVILIALLCVSILIGVLIYRINNIGESEQNEEKILLSEKIEDECTEEWEELNNKNVISANSEEDKITPNTRFIIEKIYSKCGHAVKEEVEVPSECVNKTKEELESEYKNWEIKSFSNDEVVISKDETGICNKHYILRECNGVVAIYVLNSEGEEVFKEETSIGIEYLTETDLLSIRQGMQIYGDEKLNSFLEDFE